MTVDVRSASAGDEPFILDLSEAFLSNLRVRSPLLPLPSDFASKYIPKLLRDSETKGGAFLIAESDGDRAGFIAVLPQERPSPWDESTGKSCIIMEFHVHPAHRRQAIGTTLLREVESRFALLGYDWITLGVFASNSMAHRLYDRLGYKDAYAFMGKRLATGP